MYRKLVLAALLTLSTALISLSVMALPSSGTYIQGWVPTQLSSLVGFIDFRDNSRLTIVSGAVSAVTDAIGGTSFSQATAGSRPTLTTNASQGQIARCDGTVSALASASYPTGWPTTGAIDIWGIGTQDAADADANTRQLVTVGSGTITSSVNLSRRQNGGVSQTFVLAGNGTISASASVPTATIKPNGNIATRVSTDGTTLVGYVNNVASAGVALAGLGITATRARICATSQGSAAQFWQGDISAILVFNTVLSGDSQALMWNWAMTRKN